MVQPRAERQSRPRQKAKGTNDAESRNPHKAVAAAGEASKQSPRPRALKASTSKAQIERRKRALASMRREPKPARLKLAANLGSLTRQGLRYPEVVFQEG